MRTPNISTWLLINFKIGALSFGSAGRALLYREALVEKYGWLTSDEFQEVMTLTQVLPGPNLANLCAYLGFKLTNWIGAIAGLLMLAAPGAMLLVTTYKLLGLDNPNFNSFFHGVSIGSITLFFILIFRTIKGLKQTATQVPISKIKYAARTCVGIGVATLAILQMPISFVLSCGALTGLAIEFAL